MTKLEPLVCPNCNSPHLTKVDEVTYHCPNCNTTSISESQPGSSQIIVLVPIPVEAQPQPSEDISAKTTSRPRWGRILVWVGVFALLTLLALGLRRAQQGPVGVGHRVPNFTLTSFDGQTYKIADLKGKVVVLNFWASWCIPCEEEAEILEAAWRHYQPRGDVVFLGADYVDTEPEARAYLEKFGITYPNGPDLGTRISQAFRMGGVPETYIIDQEGVLQHMQYGVFPSIDSVKAVVDPLLE